MNDCRVAVTNRGLRAKRGDGNYRSHRSLATGHGRNPGVFVGAGVDAASQLHQDTSLPENAKVLLSEASLPKLSRPENPGQSA